MNKLFQENKLWIFQRLSAVSNLILLTWVFFSLDSNVLLDYNQIVIWLNEGFNAFLIFLLFGSLSLHANLGISVIIYDYIYQDKTKIFLMIFKNLFFAGFLLILGICLYLI